MSSNGLKCMRFFWRRKTLKTRILVSNQAVLHTNNATIGTQNKENNKIFRTKAFKQKSKTIKLLPLKKGGKRRWIKRQIHQLNTMQKTSIKEVIHKLHAANQERITSPAVSKTSQSASIRCSKKPIKKVWQPSQSITRHTDKGGRGGNGGGQREDRNIEGCRRGSQSTWKDTEKHRHVEEERERERQREWTIHPHVQIF